MDNNNGQKKKRHKTKDNGQWAKGNGQWAKEFDKRSKTKDNL